MKTWIKYAHRFFNEEDGQSTAEYILILAIVVMVVMRFRKDFVDRIEDTSKGIGRGIDQVLEQMNNEF